jgi:hypothetical protein
MARPDFPWAPIDALVDEMVTRLIAFRTPAMRPQSSTACMAARTSSSLTDR